MQDLYFQDKDFIKKKQWQFLQEQLTYTRKNSPYYQKLFKDLNFNAKKIFDYSDFQKLPVTTKEDLQRFNSQFLSVPEEDVIDYVTTSGTLGNPVNFMLNDHDLHRLAQNEFEAFRMAGVTKQDKVIITTTLDRRFMAGMAYFLGLRKLGAGIIRSGSGLPLLQWDSIQRFQPKYIVAVPSFLLKLVDYAEENGIDYKNSSVKAAVCIGEPLRDPNFELNALGRRIKEKWNIELFSTYASTEMSTAFMECEFHQGNHELSDLIFSEVLDDNGNQVKPGEIGELVVTPLQTQTMPLLRFGTGDMLSYTESTCKCGRQTKKLGSVVGRKRQKIKYKGTSIYPQHIIEVLNNYGKLELFVIEARKDDLGNDLPVILIADNRFDKLQRELKELFQARLQVIPKFEKRTRKELEKLSFPKDSRKQQIFYDLRT
ncbi:AMP-binding protein [Gramella sp. AN32]|uniref:Phenylacetate--CoA ligase family protein n=1 Tax=Christiangramia antarctica TaxID=2058158 RepID=A0ABW5WZF6_9FLAO|nr:AMP-binding protein [Gramella sp. AN32]MCM4156769.1 phenylacetate--CoA ligase [Gramella sp. AN32]